MKKKGSFIAAYWWCMLLFVLGAAVLLLGNREGGVSETENRTLQALPHLSFGSWFDGTFASGLESYLSDQMPGRDPILNASNRMLGIFDATSEKDMILDQGMIEQLDEMANAHGDEPSGAEEPAHETPQAQMEVDTVVVETSMPAQTALTPPTAAPAGAATPAPAAVPISVQLATPEPTPVDPAVKDTSVVRRFALRRTDGTTKTLFQFGQTAIERTADALNAYRSAVPEDGSVIFTYIPYSQDANTWLLEPDKYNGWTSDVEPTLQANVVDGVYVFSTVNELEPHMQAGELCYFKTDHHWSGLGAYYMQSRMMRTFGVPDIAYEDFAFTVHEKFSGSIAASVHSMSAYRNLYDRLEVPTPLAPARAFVYRNLNHLVKEVRFMEPERVVYAAFLGGTHTPFYVAETGFHTGRNALVICDSFGLAFVPFIAPYYDRVCLADLREDYSFPKEGGASLRKYIEYYGIDDVYFIVARGCGINSLYMQRTVVKYLG